MRNPRVALSLVFLALLVGAAVLKDSLAQTAQQRPPEPCRIAVCDLVKVIQSSPRINELNALFQKKQQALRAEEAARIKEIEDLQASLKLLAEDSQEYEQRLEQVVQKSHELNAWKESQVSSIDRWHYLSTRQMFQEALNSVETVARQLGYHLVLFKENPELKAMSTDDLAERIMTRRKVLYSDESLDITAAVVSAVKTARANPAQ